MAAEMSCLTGVDEDDKDADPDINALTLLQEPVRMAQESASCTNSFGKPSLKQNSVLDVLSNTDMLSPVGLGNGPSSHQATQAHELNSISTEKEEAKSITPLKTVQEIDTAGIWGFDVDSPENSVDNFSGASDLHWDPHKEFMQFLWENHGDSPGEEPKDEVLPANSQRRRKRKMDMVVMVDPSEDLYPDLSHKPSEDLSDAEDQEDSIPLRKVRKSRKFSPSQSSPTGKVSKYPNGTSFRQSGSLIEHMSTHTEKTARLQTEKKARLTEEIKCVIDQKKEDKKLFCPQCPFGTNCPNTFVKHAKTHEKDKRKFRCDKCSFRSLSESDLRRHNIMQHTVITVTKQIQNDKSGIFSCNICSYRALSENVFRNHLLRRHQQTFEEYEAAQRIEENAQPLNEQHMPTSQTSVEDAEFTSKISIKNQISSKRACSPSESNDISDLFKNSKINRGLKSQLTESKLDKSINVLLSRQRHGKKTAEQRKESNNHSTFVQDSIGDKDGSDQLPGTLSVKAEDSAKSPNGHRVSSSPAEGDQSTVRKSPSKRKMSTPYRNTSDQDSCFILPKPLPSPKKMNQDEEEVSDNDEKDIFQFNDTDGNTDLFDSGIKKENQNIIYTYSRRMSMRGALQASKRLFEKIKTEDEDPTEPEIKEECIETEVFQETFDSHQIPLREDFTEDLSDLELDRKNCPYCPAVFESGVGLSNHVRGHLHRVGLAYNARHVVSPEQVASQDRRPRIRRKISAIRRLKKALQLESESETVKSIHSCPLCGDSFDNRTGQSNHIRGHLKKLGKSFATKNKSPLFLLRELMRDKKEFQRALQILGKRRNHFQYSASSKLSSVDHFMQPPIGIPKCNSIPSACTDARPLMPTFSLVEIESEKRQLETKFDVKNSLSGTNALIGILKKRKCQEDSRIKGSSQMSKNMLAVSSNSEHCSGSRVASSLPKSICEKGEFNRKEDWIKHLQRHIMNTSVPHTGLGMVEVASLPTDPRTLKTDQDRSLTATHAAS
ncbi:hypothetical protein FQN60_016596 [Etheostoma spectabile]|uniref:C2H2-type domain-containing protein n=1 Tax=Etheostoma spectabile TaxID=54343 RepID=A0A5J5D2Y2_9PERO|nr:hypothetical protein FQN60_016596 [Etheostoma spectabile]